jgi:hypothetical protein
VDPCKDKVCPQYFAPCDGKYFDGCCELCPPNNCQKSLADCFAPAVVGCYATFNATSCSCGVVCKRDHCVGGFDCPSCVQDSVCDWFAQSLTLASTGLNSPLPYGRCQSNNVTKGDRICVKPVKPVPLPPPELCAYNTPLEIVEQTINTCHGSLNVLCKIRGIVSTSDSCKTVRTVIECFGANGVAIDLTKVAKCVPAAIGHPPSSKVDHEVGNLAFVPLKRGEQQTTSSSTFVVTSTAPSDGLSAGAIAGIIVGCVCGALLILGIIAFIVFKTSREERV